MTEPSQYFKGRTIQEQMNEVIGYVDVRSAEVATDAIAADVAQVHQDMLDADADASAAAASAAAAAGTLANAVKKTGEASQSIAGDISVSGDVNVGADLAVTGDAGVQGNLSVLGDCDFNDDVKVPTVATGTFNDNAANGTKVKNELDNYAAMVRIANNQNVTGDKTDTYNASTYSGSVAPHGWINKTNIDTSAILDSGNRYVFAPALVDTNGRVLCAIRVQQASSGGGKLIFSLATSKLDGTLSLKQLGEYNQTSDTWS
jgi:hypothetical protein